MKTISVILRIARTLVLAGLASTVFAQDSYPSKPVRFIVPYAAGGSVEPLVRLFTTKLTESLGQPMIVDPRPGGNTVIGTDIVAKAAPDGYTVLVMTVPNHAINALLIRNLPYDSIRDFAPVTTVSTSDYVLVLHPSVPADSLKAFIALAKSRPGELNYGSIGSGGISQLGVEVFCMMTGIKMHRIPYKGSAPALIDLVSGQLHAGFNTPISAAQHVRNRRLKAIAVSGEQRNTALPEVPTFAEAGLPGFEMRVTYAVLAPAGTARGIIEKLSSEFGKIVAMPDIRERLAERGMMPLHSKPDQVAALLQADLAKYAKVIKVANIKLD